MTPSYVAPEVLEGYVTDTSDQYSLAVTYCEMRGGRLPFTGGANQVIYAHLHKEPDLSALPAEERPVVARALAKDPDAAMVVAAASSSTNSATPRRR